MQKQPYEMTIDHMLNDRRFNLRRVDSSDPYDMAQDVQEMCRRRAASYSEAIVHRSFERNGGMILLRLNSKNSYEGVFYKAGDCGTSLESVRLTAEALCLLGAGTSGIRIFENFLSVYSKIRAVGLGTENPILEPI